MKYDYIISDDELKRIKHLFWIIHCDETKDDVLTHQSTYDVLVALESYRKVVTDES